MSTLLFLTILSVSGGCAAVVVAILHRPLLRVVIDLCGTRDRGVFWTVYAWIMIVLSPMLAVSYGISTDRIDWGDTLLLERCTSWSLLALMGALAIFGFTLWKPTNRLFESRHSIGERLTRPPTGSKEAS